MAWAWIVVGAAVGVVSLCQLGLILGEDRAAFFSGAAFFWMFACAYGLAGMAGGVAEVNRKSWGRALMVVCAVIVLVFTGVFFVTAGNPKENLLHYGLVVFLSHMGFFTFIGLRRSRRSSE